MTDTEKRYARITELLTKGSDAVVHYTTKDGKPKVMTAQPGEAAFHIIGSGAGHAHGSMLKKALYPQNLNVFSKEADNFRTVNMDTVSLIVKDGEEITVFE